MLACVGNIRPEMAGQVRSLTAAPAPCRNNRTLTVLVWAEEMRQSGDVKTEPCGLVTQAGVQVPVVEQDWERPGYRSLVRTIRGV